MVKDTAEGGGTDLGSISIVRAGSGNVTLNWTGGAGIRLQKTPSLATPAWADVQGSTGVSTLTIPASGSYGFFRLAR
jgi:hypothetical protein